MTTLYVGNLPFETNTAKLESVFAPHKPTSAEVQERRDGRSRGFGLVKFTSEDAANAAIDALNNTEVDGREIYVRIDRDADPNIESDTKLYVGNLPWSTTDAELKGLFAGSTGAEVAVGRDGRSRGYGLVGYGSTAALRAALEANLDREIDGRVLIVRLDRQRDGAPPVKSTRRAKREVEDNASGFSVFVGNLSFDTDKDSLYSAFAKFAPESADIGRGWGTVKFKSTASADKAIAEMQGKEIDGRAVRVRLDLKA